MDFSFTEDQILLRDSVRKLMARVATPDYVARLDRERAYPHELFKAWSEAGLLGLPFAEELGGAGGSVLDFALVAEEIGRTSADLVMAYAGGLFCGMTVARKGSDEQKQKWIPRLIEGSIKFSIGISEPDAGSDVGAIRTLARKDGGDWVLNGRKVWQSGAGAKDNVICLYARTDTDAHYRQGMSLFLVDNTRPGVSMRKLDMLGRYCMGTYEVTLDNVRVPEDQLIGGVNKGWDCLLSGLQAERITIAACDVGSAQGAVDLALDYAKERKQFGRAIGNFQSIAHMLADMQTEVEAARSLMYRAAWMVDAGQNAMNEINMAKLFASEVYVRVANLGMQIYGGNGYSMEYPMQRHYRDSRIATVVGGTSQIMRNMIAGGMGLKPQ
ncbi:MAG: acyl-CoA dehydrogenase family protein [Pseudorhodoplanes sp.]